MATPTRGKRDRRGWDDARLVEASRSGDEAAWAALYSRHLDYTRAIAARRTADRASAEDAVAIGWAKAFERLDDLRDPARFRSWVGAAVGHAAADEVRRTERVVPSDDLTALAGDEDPVADAGVAAADRASRATVARRAFLALPERHRRVLAMALVDDLSPKQIAAELDLDPNAVSQLVHRAKNGLRRSYVRARLPESTPAKCRHAHELTIEYARGNEAVRPEITAHLAECDFCAARLTEALATRGGVWALFGSVPFALIALGALPKRTLSLVRAAFHSGTEAFQSAVQGVTSLPAPAVGGLAGGSVAVAAAVVTFSTGVVPLPGAHPSRSPASPAAAAPSTAGNPGSGPGSGGPGAQGPPTGSGSAAHPGAVLPGPTVTGRTTTTTSSTTSTTTRTGASTTTVGASTTTTPSSTTTTIAGAPTTTTAAPASTSTTAASSDASPTTEATSTNSSPTTATSVAAPTTAPTSTEPSTTTPEDTTTTATPPTTAAPETTTTAPATTSTPPTSSAPPSTYPPSTYPTPTYPKPTYPTPSYPSPTYPTPTYPRPPTTTPAVGRRWHPPASCWHLVHGLWRCP